VAIALSKKSGKGVSDGVVSELTAFFGVKPGYADQLHEACERFTQVLRSADPRATQKTGLRDSRMVIFDEGRRLLWTTTFETDWDPYLDDALLLVGVEAFMDWMQFIAEDEAEEIRAWLRQSGGADALGKGATGAAVAEAVKANSGGLKQLIQSHQVPAAAYWNALSDQMVPQIRKATRVEEAFQQVLDDPAAEQALQQPALKPLLEQAAD
jgi:hypothetical protein